MAITETIQAKEFTAGAPDITLKGDLRPNQMMASMQENEEVFMRLVDDFMERGFSLQEAIEAAKEEFDKKAMAYGGRAEYGLGSIVKSIGKAVKGAVKGVAKGAKKFVKSDLGKAALLIGGGMYAGGLGPFANMKGAGFLGNLSMPSFGLSTKGANTLKAFAIGSLGSAVLSAAEAGGLDTSDPNAEVDLESLTGYLTKGYKNLNPNATDEEVFQFVQENTAEYRATGGRIGYAMGTDEKVTMAAGIEGLPVRQNKAGVKELDLRETGGFIQPVGIKEKADDIPAMLSNNEFVFTADAVRAAGGGDIDKGAQLMYDTMKKLESKVV